MPRRPRPVHPEPEPLEADEVKVAAVGTALFALTLLALLPFLDRLEAAGLDWLLWSCVTGIVLGLLGLVYTRRRRDRQARRDVLPEREARQPEPPVGRPGRE